MPEKIIRDPVHDVIAFQMERPADALLFRLVNSQEVQRLRRIRQLGMASLAYLGADHSRYSHSLGVMQTARLMLEQLRQSCAISEEEETACLAASLLHDLGHGPFSHVFERVGGMPHEKITRRIVNDPASEVHQTLAKHDPMLPTRVCELLEGKSARQMFCDILSSQLDADRLDYLLRDNLMAGSLRRSTSRICASRMRWQRLRAGKRPLPRRAVIRRMSCFTMSLLTLPMKRISSKRRGAGDKFSCGIHPVS